MNTKTMLGSVLYKKLSSSVLQYTISDQCNTLSNPHNGLVDCTDFTLIGSVAAVVPTKSDSDVIFCLQSLSKTLTCTLHLSIRESINHLCINPILRI